MTTTNISAEATSTTNDDAGHASPQDRLVTMTALTQHRYGSADTLAVEQVSLPEVGDTDVLIEVVAAGIDRGVCHLMTGTPYLIRLAGFGFLKPKNPVMGMDVAGRVAAVGASVGRFAVGDEVMGIAKGSFAQYAVADKEKLAFKPAELSFEQAGASTISGITALQALTTVGRVEAGQNVLVIGASGGVGSFAVQIAKAHGATVSGVASAAKLDFVTSLGADSVVDYATTPLVDLDHQFDLIIDIGGRTPLRKLRRILAERGTHVIVGGEDGGRFSGGIGRNLRAVLWSMFIKQRLAFFISSESRTYIDPLVEMLANGQVVPAIGQRSTLVDAPDAIRVIERGGAVGKTVITMSA
ncbi:MAG: NADPH:quinone reductase-like Zn-dependent oxidoreductase [Ilumatobacter sp.]|jgi:NADPH:quinone reductase-like Zn-dependent oxidoreductase